MRVWGSTVAGWGVRVRVGSRGGSKHINEGRKTRAVLWREPCGSDVATGFALLASSPDLQLRSTTHTHPADTPLSPCAPALWRCSEYWGAAGSQTHRLLFHLPLLLSSRPPLHSSLSCFSSRRLLRFARRRSCFLLRFTLLTVSVPQNLPFAPRPSSLHKGIYY